MLSNAGQTCGLNTTALGTRRVRARGKVVWMAAMQVIWKISSASLEDIFGDDIFGNFFGGGGGRRGVVVVVAAGVRGSNLRVNLTFEEAAKGVTKTIKGKKYVPCTTCGGNGAKIKVVFKPCGMYGSGQVRKITNTFSRSNANRNNMPYCNGEGTTVTAKCGGCKGEGRVYGEERTT